MLPALLTLLLLVVASTSCEQDLAFAATGDPQILRDGRVPTPTFPVPDPLLSNLSKRKKKVLSNLLHPVVGHHLLPQRPIPSAPAPGPGYPLLPELPQNLLLLPPTPAPGTGHPLLPQPLLPSPKAADEPERPPRPRRTE